MGVYTTAELVAQYLGISEADLTSKFPDIEARIERAEERIDSVLGTTYKTKTVTNEYGQPQYLYDYDRWVYTTKFRPIQSITKLEVWNGGEWEDFIQTRTEGRDKDYWIDYENGHIFLPVLYSPYFLSVPRIETIRVTYTYGYGATATDRSKVPKTVEDIATKMVAIEILRSEGYTTVLPTGEGGTIAYDRRVEMWEEEVRNWLNSYVAFKPIDTWR